MLTVDAVLRGASQHFCLFCAVERAGHALTDNANIMTFRTKERAMVSVADLYLSGFAKPLGHWSERALDQVRTDVEQLLAVETNAEARVELSETLMVLDAEARRREGALTPAEAKQLEEKGATRSFSERVEDAKEFIGEMRSAVMQAFNRGAEATREARDRSGSGAEPGL